MLDVWARISPDTRRVDVAHLRVGRGAPDLDREPPPGLDWFPHLDTGDNLAGIFAA
ncbi:MAG: hypothetical protein KTR19_05435 [Hyphomicrobiales bacterium]|nr:hypothetical protein [Hyphomicrobiales bacterium]